MEEYGLTSSPSPALRQGPQHLSLWGFLSDTHLLLHLSSLISVAPGESWVYRHHQRKLQKDSQRRKSDIFDRVGTQAKGIQNVLRVHLSFSSRTLHFPVPTTAVWTWRAQAGVEVDNARYPAAHKVETSPKRRTQDSIFISEVCLLNGLGFERIYIHWGSTVSSTRRVSKSSWVTTDR